MVGADCFLIKCVGWMLVVCRVTLLCGFWYCGIWIFLVGYFVLVVCYAVIGFFLCLCVWYVALCGGLCSWLLA